MNRWRSVVRIGVPVALACVLLLGLRVWLRSPPPASVLNLEVPSVWIGLPKDPRLAYLILSHGNRHDALAYFKWLYNKSPDNAVLAALFGGVRARVEENDGARFILSQASRLDPSSCLVPCFLGDIALDEDDFAQAKRCYRRAARMSDRPDTHAVDRALACYRWATISLYDNDLREARRAIELARSACVQLKLPADDFLLSIDTTAALIAMLEGRHKHARQILVEAYHREPTETSATNLARLLMYQHRLAQGESVLEEQRGRAGSLGTWAQELLFMSHRDGRHAQEKDALLSDVTYVRSRLSYMNLPELWTRYPLSARHALPAQSPAIIDR